MPRRYWLLKSDPATFGLEHLKASPSSTTRWDGVRNYQARNYLRDGVLPGDGVLFYHSQLKPPTVVATADVVRGAYPDPTQFDERSGSYDPKSSAAQPRWYAVDIRLAEEFRRPVTLTEIRATPKLAAMALLQKGSRLSVQPVTADEWRIVCKLGRRRGS